MGNQEGTLSYTLNYEDSGFSDVATSSLEASYTSEYEQDLKSMFVSGAELSNDRPITPLSPLALQQQQQQRVTSTPLKSTPIGFTRQFSQQLNDQDCADDALFARRRPDLVKSSSIGIASRDERRKRSRNSSSTNMDFDDEASSTCSCTKCREHSSSRSNSSVNSVSFLRPTRLFSFFFNFFFTIPPLYPPFLVY